MQELPGRFFFEVATVLSSSLHLGKVLDSFVDVVLERFADGCVLLLAEEDGTLRLGGAAHRDPQVQEFLRTYEGAVPTARGGPIEEVMKSKRPLLLPEVQIDDVRARARDDEHFNALERLQMRSLIVVPMLVADDLIGTISFISSDPVRRFDERDLEIAIAATLQVAIVVENLRLFERERVVTERFRFLARATDQLFVSADFEANIQHLLNIVVEGSADWAALFTLEYTTNARLRAIAAHDSTKNDLLRELRGQRILTEEGEHFVTQSVLRHRATLESEVRRERFEQFVRPYILPHFTGLIPRSTITIPLYTADLNFGALVLASAERYKTVDLELFEEVGRRVALSLEHAASVERERRLGETLQEATLPAQLPHIPGAIISTAYAPATTTDAQVGGDWYDAFELGDGRVVLSIGDVTGRGLQASAIMGKLRHSLNVIAMYESDPARILDAVEAVLQQRYPNTIATAFVAIYDPSKRRISYANAGHPHPLLRLTDGTVDELDADGLPIGLRTFAAPAESRTRDLDDVLLLMFYTDGITEATGDLIAGERRLREVLASPALPYVRSPADVVEALCLPPKVQDDVALLILGFPNTVGWAFDAENARAATDARGAFLQLLKREALPEGDFAGAETIFGELIGNVVRHAPGPIDIALEWRDDAAILHVIDRGDGFKLRRVRRADVLSEDGRGLWLIENFGRDLRVESLPGFGTHVSVELPVTRDGALPKARLRKQSRRLASRDDAR